MKTLFLGHIRPGILANPTGGLLVENHRVTAVGREQDLLPLISSQDEVIRFPGKVLLPAFYDTHTHFTDLSKSLFMVDLAPYAPAQWEKIMRTFADKTEDWWLGGGGWTLQPDLPQTGLALLDKIFPQRPVYLWSRDMHTLWVNTATLNACGLNTNTPDPPGGRLGRWSDGRLNGFVHEKAWDLILPHVVAPPAAVWLTALRGCLQNCQRLGLAGVHTMEGIGNLDNLKRVAQESPFRLCVHFPYDQLPQVQNLGLKGYEYHGYWGLGGQKLFLDGSLGSRTAWMFAPYPDGSTGFPTLGENTLASLIQKGADASFASALHVIGDRTLAMCLNVLAACPHPSRHRLEHVQCARPEDILRLARLGCHASVQPIHLDQDADWLDEYWPDSKQNAYPFASLLSAGVELSFSSDAPVAPINPWSNIHLAVTRQPGFSSLNRICNPGERLSLSQALYASTTAAARAYRQPELEGVLKPGAPADLIITDDWFTEPERPVWQLRCYYTMIDGVPVFRDLA